MPRLAAVLPLHLCGFLLVAAPASDLVIFDEDDPLGREYYDASIGSVTRGSSLRLLATSRDKMPVTTNSAVSGQFSAVLEWTSHPGSSWSIHIFAPGFPILNLNHYDAVTFALNGPRAIAAKALPLIQFQDTRGTTISCALGDVLKGGLDADPTTWQRVALPFSSFSSADKFDNARTKHITFHQADGECVAHALWIDDLRLRNPNRVGRTNAPSGVKKIIGRAGDRSITLHWDAVRDENLQHYRVYRGEAGAEPRMELAGSPVKIQSIADVQVENGRNYFYQVKAENEAGIGPASATTKLTPRPFSSNEDFLEYLQATAFDYFYYEANPVNGMIRDRTQPWSAASIAAIGFGLTAMGIGIDHGWITRAEGRERVLTTLKGLWHTPQGAAEGGMSGYKGWYYHFLNFEDGTRFGSSELSSIDTALLLAGVLDAREFFAGNDPMEIEIRTLADRIFKRVDWVWMLNRGETLAMGWYPERGFTKARWKGYNEASILYILGLGATQRNGLRSEHWKNWTATYDWRTSFAQSFIHFAPLFGHQYSACWIDFRNIADRYTRQKKITYFENSRRATLAQRVHCIVNPGGFPGYGPDFWGLTACDGPGSGSAHSYIARGAPPAENDDGTIAPTAAGGSLPFAPEVSIPALRAMYDVHREKIWCGYGFRDAFNLKENWWGEDVIGIDQGPILIMAENLRNGRVWERMKKSSVLQKGLKEAGFQPFPFETRFAK